MRPTGLSVAQREKELAVGGLDRTDCALASSASRTAMRSGGTHCGMVAPIIDLPREIYETAQVAR